MNFQMIDEFRRRTNASYDEAKYYLERHNGDLLSAIIAFERERMSYQNQRPRNRDYHCRQTENGGFFKGILRVIQRLIDIKLVITDKYQKPYHIPVILPLIMFPAWPIMIIMAIAMMFMGFRFGFQEMPDSNINVTSFVDKFRDNSKDNRRDY